jgi:hypothetical protein
MVLLSIFLRFAGFVLLIFFFAPTSLSKFLIASVHDDFVPQILVSLLRGDVVDALSDETERCPWSQATLESGDAKTMRKDKTSEPPQVAVATPSQQAGEAQAP